MNDLERLIDYYTSLEDDIRGLYQLNADFKALYDERKKLQDKIDYHTENINSGLYDFETKGHARLEIALNLRKLEKSKSQYDQFRNEQSIKVKELFNKYEYGLNQVSNIAFKSN